MMIKGGTQQQTKRGEQFVKLATMMATMTGYKKNSGKTREKAAGRARERGTKKTTEKKAHLDALIVGGGINGAVTALCLAHHGYKVALVEAEDFAGRTSQASSNLIWGGIKYLENFEFGLVRKLSKSRNRLLQYYPSLVRELRFLAPHKRSDKHGLLKLYLGAWFYWIWGGFRTATPGFHTQSRLKQTQFPLNMTGLTGGFEYSDAYLIENDARFVFNLIRQAEVAGAAVLNYTALTTIRFNAGNHDENLPQKASAPKKTAKEQAKVNMADKGNSGKQSDPNPDPEPYWEGELYDKVAQKTLHITAQTFINAAGPYIDGINSANRLQTQYHHVFSKGVHLIVKRLLPDRRALAFYANDGRLFFALPMGHRTCIGTTDTFVKKADVTVRQADRTFILENINALLKLSNPLTVKDIIAERCGVRPLAQLRKNENTDAATDWFALSRKHVIEKEAERRYLSIFGGKLTDCLNVGEEVYRHVRTWLDPDSSTDPHTQGHTQGHTKERNEGRTEGRIEAHSNHRVNDNSSTKNTKDTKNTNNTKEKGANRWFGEPSHEERQFFLKRAERLISVKAAHCLWRRYNHASHTIMEQLETVWRRATAKSPITAEYLRNQTVMKQHVTIVSAMIKAMRSKSTKKRGPRSKPLKLSAVQKKQVTDQYTWQGEWTRLSAPLVEGSDVMVIEAEYSLRHEWVVTMEDFLRRRTMLALTVPAKQLRIHKTLVTLKKTLKEILKQPLKKNVKKR